MKRFFIGIMAVTVLGAPKLAYAQDAKRGEHVFKRCLLCHVASQKTKDMIGPPLVNIIGRKAATVPGFEYSKIMRVAGTEGLVWTPEALFYFLDRPEEFMPGTYMAFSGLEVQERRDVIAYLERLGADWKKSNPPDAGAVMPAIPLKPVPGPPPLKPAPAKAAPR
ncbi:MAG: c-type cytochrome [Hyphomicrobiaceae bacterium]